MVTDRVFVKNDSGSWIHNMAREKLTRVLVPVSFSDLSYNALAYAFRLVKAFNGVIDLFHVIDIDDVVESDNPIVVQRWLVKREKESVKQIQSLGEIIGESQIHVSSIVVVTGNTRSCLQRRIREVNPDLIVLGNSSKADNLVTFLSETSSCPVLAVPFVPTLGLPSRIALATDKKPVSEGSLSSFFRIVQHTTQSFSILNSQKKERCAVYVNSHGLRVSHIESESLDVYLVDNRVDLLCTIHRRQSFLKRLFQRRTLLESLRKQDIPILIVKEAE